jgi:hypothetical protein
MIVKNLAQIIEAIDNADPGLFQAVDYGSFSRKKPSEEQIDNPEATFSVKIPGRFAN